MPVELPPLPGGEDVRLLAQTFLAQAGAEEAVAASRRSRGLLLAGATCAGSENAIEHGCFHATAT
ncbi:MAG: hypothetical protein R3E53_12350 [Myxococcota bacterium]